MTAGPAHAGPARADAPTPSVVVDVPVPRVRREDARAWLPLLETVARSLPTVLVARDARAARDLRRLTSLRVVRARTTDELTAVYDVLGAAVVLHPLTARRTFQALSYRRALHVYLGPPEAAGEDGTSRLLVAFDRVLVHDDAQVRRVLSDLPAIDRHRVAPVSPRSVVDEVARVVADREVLLRSAPDLPEPARTAAALRGAGVRVRAVELAFALAEGPGRRVRSALVRVRSRGAAPQVQAVVGRADVVLYVADDPARLYQAGQWLRVLEALDGLEVAVVARHPGSAAALRRATSLPVHLAVDAAALRTAYRELGARVVLYPSNSVRNVDSLGARSVRHLHVGHGESDKASSVARQSFAYDLVVVAGQVAIERFRRGLLDGDRLPLVACGRPQLDVLPAPMLDRVPGRRTVLYAPTWFGESQDNNFTSLDVLGEVIVRACVTTPGIRAVYRPHPRTLAAPPGAERDAHERVLAVLREAAERDPGAGHVCSVDGDVTGLLDAVDLVVGDVSSVLIDVLVLRPDAPVLVTDRRADRAALVARSPLAGVVPVLEPGSEATVSAVLAEQFDHDPARSDRERLRDRYVAYPPGTATAALQALLRDEVRASGSAEEPGVAG